MPMEISHQVEQYNTDLRLAYLLSKKLGGKIHLEYHYGNRVIFELISYREELPEKHSNTFHKLKGQRVLLIDEKDARLNMLTMLDMFGMRYSIANTYSELTILHQTKKYVKSFTTFLLNILLSLFNIIINYSISDIHKGDTKSINNFIGNQNQFILKKQNQKI